MKIKSLLLAGLFASMCVSASAYDETASYLSINGGEVINSIDADGYAGFDAAGQGLVSGDEIYVPIYIMNEGNIMPKNLEFAIEIPEGIIPDASDPITPSETLTKRVGRTDVPLLNCKSSFHEEAWTDESGTALPARSLKVVLDNNDNNNPVDCGDKADVCYLLCKVGDAAEGAELELKIVPPTKFACEGQTLQNSVEQVTKVKIAGTAVESVKGDKAIAGVKYYNVAGIESNEAFEGVNIKVVKYVDGTTKAVKVVK